MTILNKAAFGSTSTSLRAVHYRI